MSGGNRDGSSRRSSDEGMTHRCNPSSGFFWLTVLAFLVPLFSSRAKSTINSDMVLVIDGKKVFPIGFTTPPPPDGQTPEGTNGLGELANAGATFLRTGGPWTEGA